MSAISGDWGVSGTVLLAAAPTSLCEGRFSDYVTGVDTQEKIEIYQDYRNAARDYLSHVVTEIDNYSRNIKRIGKLLGLYRENTLHFEDERESLALIDFILSERLFGGKSKIEQELDSGRVKDEKLIKILIGYKKSTTSLYEVTRTDKATSTVYLHDVLGDGGDTSILDIQFSDSAQEGVLLFLRLVSVDEIRMTSGSAFVFDSNHRDLLLRRYRYLSKTSYAINPSVTRFIVFFKLNRKYGLPLELI